MSTNTAEKELEEALEATSSDDAEAELRKRGIYYILGEINESSLKTVHQDILLKHCTDDWDDDHNITLIINSPGGELDSAWALVDLLDFIRMPVTTIAMGSCHSAATLLLVAGTKGRRIVAPNAALMVHRFTWGNYDKQAELIEHRRAEDQEHEKMVRLYLERTKYKTRKELEKSLLRPVDTWLTAQEAHRHGLADHVLARKTEKFNQWKILRKALEKKTEKKK